MENAPSLHVSELVCGHGERGLFAPVSFVLESGQALQVAGANGQGKTTLLRAIVGLGRPLSGRVEWRAQTELSEAVTWIGHDNGLHAALTPLENLDLLLRLGGYRHDEQRARKTLAELGLERVTGRPCGRLSAGQKRRVALSRLWLERSRLWLLDEPGAALDAAARSLLCRRMATFVQKGGMLLFTTHEPLQLPGVTADQLVLQPC